MGIPSSHARLLMRASKTQSFAGSVLQLGRQDVAILESTLSSIAVEENFELSKVHGTSVYRESRYAGVKMMNDEYFFRRLGFTTVHSLDVSEYEGADVLHDLNIPLSSNSTHAGKYDLIFDGGTSEHVFHLPNLLENIFKMLAVDGRVIHTVPIDAFNHGFYNFSSCLFEDFYEFNGFEINSLWVTKMPNNSFDTFYTSVNRDSQFIRSLCDSTFNNARHNLFIVAKKLSTSTGNKIPVQGYYDKVFKDESNLDNRGLVEGNSSLKSIYRTLRSIPIISFMAKYLRNLYAHSLVKWEKI
jgi:hypothetical protein